MNNDNLAFGHKRLRDLGAANRFRVWQAVKHLGREYATISDVADFTRIGYEACRKHLTNLGIRLHRQEYERSLPPENARFGDHATQARETLHDSIVEVDAFMSRPSDGLTLSDVVG